MINYTTYFSNQSIPVNLANQIIDKEYNLQSEFQNNLDPTVQVTPQLYEDWQDDRVAHEVIYTLAVDEDTNHLVGCVRYLINQFKNKGLNPNLYYPVRPLESMHISQLYVDTNYRKQHIGSTFFQHIESLCSRYNIKRLDLQTAYKNTTAQAFYSKLGFITKFSTLNLSPIQKTIVNPPSTSYHIDKVLLQQIVDSLDHKKQYYDNNYSLSWLESNIVKQINDHIYSIFSFQDLTNHIVWTYKSSANELVLLDYQIAA